MTQPVRPNYASSIHARDRYEKKHRMVQFRLDPRDPLHARIIDAIEERDEAFSPAARELMVELFQALHGEAQAA